ncbi:hypothetical protein [Albirhodobacter sp. R86504]|uniref:hypothetical protein n=1 Tax=Albirhodobacter sp. R86504 TaxID=3093848 RepID=UPI003671069C
MPVPELKIRSRAGMLAGGELQRVSHFSIKGRTAPRALRAQRHRLGAVLALVFALSGCAVTQEGGLASPAKRDVLLAAGTMKFTAPRGYCVDAQATRATADGGFALFGSCASLNPLRSFSRPKLPVALAAMVTGAGPEQPLRQSFPALERFFQSRAGRAALSRTGDASTVALIELRREGDILMIHLTDTSVMTDSAQMSETYWRALASIGGRMVSLSALPRAGYEIDDADQRALLLDFASRVEDLR